MKNWRIEVKPTAEKQYLKLDRKVRAKIKKALQDLETFKSFAHYPREQRLLR